MRRSTVDYCSNEDGILVAKWKDSRVATMITNDVGVEPINQIERYDKETKRNIMVNCSNVIISYNSHMGGIRMIC